MKSMQLFLLSLFLLSLSCSHPFSQYNVAEMEELWGDAIRKFDQLNRQQPARPGCILFYGSSSIRLWSDMEADMAPHPVVRRGYGGASLHDAAYFARRVLRPIDYSALVIFVGNDIWGKPTDKSPYEMLKLTKHIVDVSRRHRPDAPIFLIEVTHAPARAHLVEKWDAANSRLRNYAGSEEYLHYIPTRDIFIGTDEKIRVDLFKDDNIHINEQGYALWTGRIKEGLKKILDQV